MELKPALNKENVNQQQNVAAIGENIFGISANYVTMCLYYNKELLKKEGIEPPSFKEGLWTWENYAEYAKKLTVDMSGKNAFQDGFNSEHVKTYGTIMPTSWEAITALAASAGALDLLLVYGDGLRFSDEKINVIQSIADLSLKHNCAPDHVAANSTYADAAVMLMSGRLAFFIGDTDAFADYANKGFDVGVAPLPYFRSASNIKWSDFVCVSETSANKKNAVDFLVYYTDFSNMVKSAEKGSISIGSLPPPGTVYENKDLFEQWVLSYQMIDAAGACEIFADILTAKDTKSIKKIEGEDNDLLDRIMENIWSGSSDARTALEHS